jgi:hypothetical protein
MQATLYASTLAISRLNSDLVPRNRLFLFFTDCYMNSSVSPGPDASLALHGWHAGFHLLLVRSSHAR